MRTGYRGMDGIARPEHLETAQYSDYPGPLAVPASVGSCMHLVWGRSRAPLFLCKTKDWAPHRPAPASKRYQEEYCSVLLLGPHLALSGWYESKSWLQSPPALRYIRLPPGCRGTHSVKSYTLPCTSNQQSWGLLCMPTSSSVKIAPASGAASSRAWHCGRSI